MPHVLLAFGLGAAEIAIILVVVLLIFGPSKLPQLGEGIGKMLRGFKKEMKSLEEEKAREAEGDRPGEIDVTPKPPLEDGKKQTG